VNKQQHSVIGGLIRPLSEAPLFYKQMMRLIRRAREHHVFIEKMSVGKNEATIVFCTNIAVMAPKPGRVVRVRDDGSVVPQIAPIKTEHGMRSDRMAMCAIKTRLGHAELNWAADCRRRGWIVGARAGISLARQHRLSGAM
jgi:hypothetical protein